MPDLDIGPMMLTKLESPQGLTHLQQILQMDGIEDLALTVHTTIRSGSRTVNVAVIR
ncbi:hypothetical protein [Pararhizobium sp. IMCC21322]|uniref:hypothetical protein n=1 Tax=Pararhizobium sp. IMCC21322 TaxID=3067903 RepID=UPI002741A60D|nr:hypothetical protein [Pararhizobium sp. IMCC21322]